MLQHVLTLPFSKGLRTLFDIPNEKFTAIELQIKDNANIINDVAKTASQANDCSVGNSNDITSLRKTLGVLKGELNTTMVCVETMKRHGNNTLNI